MAIQVVAVVIRHLPNHTPLPSTVITSDSNESESDSVWKARDGAKSHIKEFCETFVEFQEANWSITIMDASGYGSISPRIHEHKQYTYGDVK